MMSEKDDVILETKRLIGAIGDAMATVSRFLEVTADEGRREPGLRCRCDLLTEDVERLNKLLKDSLWEVKHQWNEIAGNEMLMEDLKVYIGCCREFLKTAWEFDDLVHVHWREAEELFGRNDIGRRYLKAILGWEDEAKAIIDYTDRLQPVGARLDDVFEKAAEMLWPFMGRVTGTALENFVMNGVSLANKPEWKQEKRQAVVMGKMLGKSCKEMNDSFTFLGLDGRPTKLNYTSNAPKLDYDQYKIYLIIKDMLDGIERKKNEGRRDSADLNA